MDARPRGFSSGTTTALQQYPCPALGARYVRITGYGNTENNWNSITEVKLFGP